MANQHVELNFNYPFDGKAINDRGYEIAINEGEGVYPYDMLLSALGSCLYATFVSLTDKKKITFETVHMDISGEKREEIPATLKVCHVVLTVDGGDNEKGLTKSMELACKYCSIYQTLTHVAEMSWEIKFA